ncbi:hypothetical protein B0H11DRAFT_2239168 [Mycena galericulata]|nr:hypothetical protein B0H11DRAFT_2239168 [Mycena galericulata]
MPPRNEILHSRSWWADFHRRKAAACISHRAPQPPTNADFGVLEDQHAVYTFTPHRLAPLVTTTRNDGTRVTLVSGPLLVQPLPAPAIRRPLKASRAAQRAQAILDARPSADELLLARLAEGPTARKRKADADVSAKSGASERKAEAEADSSCRRAKRYDI